jgi:hypothetical protein
MVMEAMSIELEQQAIDFLKKELPQSFLSSIKQERIKDEKWWVQGGWHSHQGMQIRNLLRDCITDDQLPSGNWDDYYVEVLEKASGFEYSMKTIKGES